MISRAPKLIIGLGNPGKKYENTYHNVGQLFIDYIKKNALCPMPYALFKSDVYMNESGRFVKKTLGKYGIKPEALLVIHDDSDIYLGDFKISCGRGAAGHHGVENVVNSLKTQDFCRVRIGIRPSPAEAPQSGAKAGRVRIKAGNFVLKKISSADQKTLKEIFQKISEDIIKPNQKSE